MNELQKALAHPVNAGAWQELYKRVASRPRRKLFHYTSVGGLAGILSSRSLWATDAEFLNDPSETQYTRNLIATVWAEMAKSLSPPLREAFDIVLGTAAETSKETDVFVASFSERGDELAQWVAYTPRVAGLSIGFRPKMFDVDNMPHLWKVVYSPVQQKRIVSDIIKRYVDAFSKPSFMEDLDQFSTLGAVMNLILHHCTLFFKDKAFATEREWRLVTWQGRGGANVRHRVAENVLVPYVEIPLLRNEGILPITDVIVGPSGDIQRNAKSIGHLLALNGIRLTVRGSNVPYRNVR